MNIDPKTLNIKNLLPGEEVKMVLQRHWIALVYIFGYFLFLVISLLVIVFVGGRMPIVGQFIHIIACVYASIFALFIYVMWMRYELDLYIITTKRIIGLEEVSFLNRHLSECLLDNVQEVNGKTAGLLSSLLDFGEVTIHTASEASDFRMLLMPDALANARRISNHLNQYKSKKD